MIGKGTQRTFGSQGIPRTAAAWLLRHRSSQGARSKALPLASACVDRRAHPAMQSASRACFRSAVATHEARAGEVRVTPVAAPMTVTATMHWIVLIPHVVDARQGTQKGGPPRLRPTTPPAFRNDGSNRQHDRFHAPTGSKCDATARAPSGVELVHETRDGCPAEWTVVQDPATRLASPSAMIS